jgi:GTP cyclohydrolase I
VKISEKIKERLKKENIRFHYNDNIADYILPGELEELQAEVQEAMQGVLSSLVIDTEHDHNTQDTAKRVAKMWLKEVFGGRYQQPPKVTAFPNMGYKSLYTSL